MDNRKNNTKSNKQAIKLFISRILDDPAWPKLLRALRGYDEKAVPQRPPIEVKSNKEKASVKIEFDTHHKPLRVKIKTFKGDYADNHLERCKHREFCRRNNLLDSHKFLKALWLYKAVNPRGRDIVRPDNLQRIARLFVPINLGETALCGKDQPQILALYNGLENHWHLYDINRDVLPLVSKQPINRTKLGNIQIGEYVSIQRRGREGELGTSYTDIDHPSNSVQVKLNVKKFYNEVQPTVKTALVARR